MRTHLGKGGEWAYPQVAGSLDERLSLQDLLHSIDAAHRRRRRQGSRADEQVGFSDSRRASPQDLRATEAPCYHWLPVREERRGGHCLPAAHPALAKGAKRVLLSTRLCSKKQQGLPGGG